MRSRETSFAPSLYRVSTDTLICNVYTVASNCVYYTVTAVIGFERTSYTGVEGEEIEICVTTFSGVNNLPNGLSVVIHFDYQEGGI